jgi:hypothetical protein
MHLLLCDYRELGGQGAALVWVLRLGLQVVLA